jgi:prevent-host-death family protein
MPKSLISERASYALASGEATRTIAAGEFKAKCLKILDEVAETRVPVVVTKFGKPVATIMPPKREKVELRGALRGSVLWEGDIISPLDVEWEANK